MNAKRRFATLLLFAFVAVFSSVEAALASALSDAREAVVKIERQIAKQDWRRAGRGLEKALKRCRDADENRNCETLLLFTAGYRFEQMTAAGEGDHLQEAKRAYAAALERSPGHAGVARRLAEIQVQLGEMEAAIRTLTAVVERRVPNWVPAALRLAELHASRDPGDESSDASQNEAVPSSWSKALAVYEEVASADPSDRASRARWVQALRKHRHGSRAELGDLAERFRREGHEALAIELLELALSGCDETTCAEAEDRLLLQWARIRAGWGTLPLTASDRLPPVSVWSVPSRQGLEVLVKTPERALRVGQTPWWRDDVERRDVAVRLMIARASSLHAEGEIDRAIELLESARLFAPEFRENESSTFAAIDAYVMLAGLYGASGRTDELSGLIRELFRSKSSFYKENDLAGIQRMHTVLGLIYSEQERYESAGRAYNAIFQLSHALDAAKKRGDASPKPDLRFRLAEAYAGAQGNAKDPALARTLFADAAMEYLDLDDLGRAAQSIARAESEPRVASLENVLAARKLGAEAIEVERDERGASRIESVYAWLNAGDGMLPESFLAGQRFKLFSDAGMAAARRGDDRAALYLQSRALVAANAAASTPSLLDASRRLAAVTTVENHNAVPPGPSGGSRAGGTRHVAIPANHLAGQWPIDAGLLRQAQLRSDPNVEPVIYDFKLAGGENEIVLQPPPPAVRAAKPNVFQRVLGIEPGARPAPTATAADLQAISEAVVRYGDDTTVRFEAAATGER